MLNIKKDADYKHRLLDITLEFCYFLVMKITIFKTKGCKQHEFANAK